MEIRDKIEIIHTIGLLRNTQKSPRDLRSVIINQTSMKDHRLKLRGKLIIIIIIITIIKEYWNMLRRKEEKKTTQLVKLRIQARRNRPVVTGSLLRY